MIDHLTCSSNSTLLEAMRIIGKNSKGICFIIDATDSLVGVATDGDIRRALLNGVELEEEIKNILPGFVLAEKPILVI